MKATDALIGWLGTEMTLRGWNNKELAQRTGISDTTIGRILMGRRSQGITDISSERIARAFGLSLRELQDIAEGIAVKTLHQGQPTTYTTTADAPGRLAVWLRQQSAELQELIFATARLHGFEKKVEHARAG